jgi:hypothetical protein
MREEKACKDFIDKTISVLKNLAASYGEYARCFGSIIGGKKF